MTDVLIEREKRARGKKDKAGDASLKRARRTPIPDSVGFATVLGWLTIIAGIAAAVIVGNAAVEGLGNRGNATAIFLASAVPFIATVIVGLALILLGQIVKFQALILRQLETQSIQNETK